jgi:hypothetical protein
MSNQLNLDALKQSISFIQALLDDPHPGLSTWREALSNAIEGIRPEQNKRVNDLIFPFFGLSLPPVGVGPFAPSGEYAELTNGPFHLDILASKQEIGDFKEVKLSVTEGYGNLVDIFVSLGLMGNVRARIVSPLTPDGPDMDIHLFNAEIP